MVVLERQISLVLGLQELVAKGVIEAAEEEMDDLVKADILAVATFCNQHSFSGKILHFVAWFCLQLRE